MEREEILDYIKSFLLHFHLILLEPNSKVSYKEDEQERENYILPFSFSPFKEKPSFIQYLHSTKESRKTVTFVFIERVYSLPIRLPHFLIEIVQKLRRLYLSPQKDESNPFKTSPIVSEKFWKDGLLVEMVDSKFELSFSSPFHIDSSTSGGILGRNSVLGSQGRVSSTQSHQTRNSSPRGERGSSFPLNNDAHTLTLRVYAKEKDERAVSVGGEIHCRASFLLHSLCEELKVFFSEWFEGKKLKCETRIEETHHFAKSEFIPPKTISLSQHPLLQQALHNPTQEPLLNTLLCKNCETRNKFNVEITCSRCRACNSSLCLKERFIFLEKLEESSTRQVWRVYDCNEKVLAVLKEAKLNQSNKRQTRGSNSDKLEKLNKASFSREISFLSQFQSQTFLEEFCGLVPRLLFSEGHTILLTEWNPSLQLLSQVEFSLEIFTKLVVDILQLLCILHDNQLVHQTIHSLNIFFLPSSKTFMLADFSNLRRNLSLNKETTPVTSNKDFIEPNFFFVAPEHANFAPNTKSDLFSFGKLCRKISEIHKIEIWGPLKTLVANLCRDNEEGQFENGREALVFLSKETFSENTFPIPHQIPLKVFDFISLRTSSRVSSSLEDSPLSKQEFKEKKELLPSLKLEGSQNSNNDSSDKSAPKISFASAFTKKEVKERKFLMSRSSYKAKTGTNKLEKKSNDLEKDDSNKESTKKEDSKEEETKKEEEETVPMIVTASTTNLAFASSSNPNKQTSETKKEEEGGVRKDDFMVDFEEERTEEDEDMQVDFEEDDREKEEKIEAEKQRELNEKKNLEAKKALEDAKRELEELFKEEQNEKVQMEEKKEEEKKRKEVNEKFLLKQELVLFEQPFLDEVEQKEEFEGGLVKEELQFLNSK